MALGPLAHLALGVIKGNAAAYSRYAIGATVVEKVVLKQGLRQSAKDNAKVYGKIALADTVGTLLLGPAAGQLIGGAATALTHPLARGAVLATRPGKIARVVKRQAQRNVKITARARAERTKIAAQAHLDRSSAIARDKVASSMSVVRQRAGVAKTKASGLVAYRLHGVLRHRKRPTLAKRRMNPNRLPD